MREETGMSEETREHTYRCVKVVTEDYGDGPACPSVAIGHLSIIPDGSHWRSRPATLELSLPLGTRPGGLWKLTLEALPPQDSERSE